jgi:hypothetical protein
MKYELKRGHKEPISLKRFIQIGLYSLALIGFFGLPLNNINNTERVLSVLSGQETVDCTIGDPTTRSPQFEAILIPGSSVSYDEIDETFKPDKFQGRRDRAAALAYVSGLVEPYEQGGPPVIYLLNGDLGSDGDPTVSARDVQEQVSLISGGTIQLPSEAIVVESNSINTATNMKEAKKILDHFGIDNALIVTDDFHLIRSVLYACASNIHASGMSVEELTELFDPKNIEEINAPNLTLTMKLKRLKEFLEIVESIWDPDGNGSIILKKLSRRYRE